MREKIVHAITLATVAAMVIAGIAGLATLESPSFESREVVVWAWVAGLYHLSVGALRVFCPGALLLLAGMVALNKWAAARGDKDA